MTKTLSTLAALALASAPVLAASDAPVVLSRHVLRDAGTGGMESHTILAPKGWTVEGHAWWAGQAYFNVLPSQDVKVTSPDGAEVHVGPTVVATDYLPGGQFGGRRPAELTANNGYPVIWYPTSLDQWKARFQDEWIGASVEGARRIRVGNVRVIPELTFMLERAFAPTLQQLVQGNTAYVRTTGECFVLGVESTYRVGSVAYDDLRLVAITAYHIDSTYTGRNTVWSVEGGVTFRAPKGELDAQLPLLKSVADSVRMTPQWNAMRVDLQARLLKIQREVAADNLRHARERSRIIAQTGREISDIIHQGYRERSAIQDRTHERVINTIRGVEDYVVPGDSSFVQLPQGYENVYTNGLGDYVLSNDLLWDPNADTSLNSQTWTSMRMRD